MVLLLVGGVIAGAVVTTRRDTSNSTSSAAGAGPTATSGSFQVTSSGRDYTAKTLATALPGLLSAQPQRTGTDAAGEALASSLTAKAQETAPRRAVAPETAALRDPQRLFDCVAALTGEPARAVIPLAVDLARFQGKPAAVIVLPVAGQPTKTDVWVVSPTCAAGKEGVLYFLRAPRAR